MFPSIYQSNNHRSLSNLKHEMIMKQALCLPIYIKMCIHEYAKQI